MTSAGRRLVLVPVAGSPGVLAGEAAEDDALLREMLISPRPERSRLERLAGECEAEGVALVVRFDLGGLDVGSRPAPV